jgi:hypothetical protein
MPRFQVAIVPNQVRNGSIAIEQFRDMSAGPLIADLL